MLFQQLYIEQAGAELSQTQIQVDMPAVAEFILTVEFHIWADFQLFRFPWMMSFILSKFPKLF